MNLFLLKTCEGKAKGLLYEDDGDGYGYMKGEYLLTHYFAELESSSSVVSIKVDKAEGSWERPRRRVNVKLLLGKGAMVCPLERKQNSNGDIWQ